ncbi:hypothetical protein RFI_29858 [Reticulomyxa filosa]|uniref:Uncharacterized protein n=1 Tax=Reticulomyxa filosa TaxID=46433 RepID=X6M034_RETFI|nr:hypothetical protein RFI_29858 [Reticulomyxa filosa]|eukprot:ETO07533.1 hypothetical protein RFI_29858 [Reticulomyxa filosa]
MNIQNDILTWTRCDYPTDYHIRDINTIFKLLFEFEKWKFQNSNQQKYKQILHFKRAGNNGNNEVQESIHKYLRDELKIKSDDALKVASYLCSLGVTETSDTAYVTPEDWAKLFKDVEVAPISQKKLLAKMDEMRSKKTSAYPAQMYLSTFFLCIVLFLRSLNG